MHRIFIPIYRFFRRNKAFMWLLLIASAAIFTFFAAKVVFIEDITKLLPKTEKAEAGGLAFGKLRVKDKVIFQIVPTGEGMSADTLASRCDEFVDALAARDSVHGNIESMLYKIRPEWLLGGMDFALEHFPAFVGEGMYPMLDSLLTPEALKAGMAENATVLENDFTGNATMAVCMDPAGIRFAAMDALKDLTGSGAGMTVTCGHFFSKDSTVVLAYLSPAFTAMDSKDANTLLETIRSTADDFNASHPDCEVLYHGATINSGGNSAQIKHDILLTVGCSLVVILLLLLICYRNRSTLAAVLIPAAYGTAAALASMYWIKGTMSIMALGIGSVILGIAVSYVLHILTHYKYVGDAEQVLKDQSTPVCLGCLTTIGAFAGLLLTSSDLLKDFGIFATIALSVSTLAALVFMPHFFKAGSERKNEKAFAFIERLNSVRLDRRHWMIAAIISLVAVCLFTSRNVGFDNNLKNIGYVLDVARRSEEIYKDKINCGHDSFYIAAADADFGTAVEKNALCVGLLDSLKAEGRIIQRSGAGVVLLTESAQQENIDRWKAYWSPEKVARTERDIAAAAREAGLDADLFDQFYAIIEGDYEPGDLMASGLVPQEVACNFIENVEGEYLVFNSVIAEAGDRKAVCDDAVSKAGAVVIDPFYYMGDMVEIVHQDFNVVLLISSLFVLAVLLISYRKLLLALLAFMPMFFSWYVVQGMMAIFGMEFNLINIIISSFIFGVGVDYSIFIMDGLLAKAQGRNKDLLLYHKTAILLSAVILVIVVCSLLLSKHPAINSVGACTLIGMTTTVLLSYCLQPFLFRQLLKINRFKKSIVKK